MYHLVGAGFTPAIKFELDDIPDDLNLISSMRLSFLNTTRLDLSSRFFIV